MRGTLHLLAAEDVKWLLALGAPGVIAGSQKRRAALGLDARTLAKARDVAERALAGGKRLARDQLIELVETRRARRRAASRVSRDLGTSRSTAWCVRGPTNSSCSSTSGSASTARSIATRRSASWSSLLHRPRSGDARGSVAVGEAAAARPEDRPGGRGQASRRERRHVHGTRLAAPKTAARSCVLLPGFDELISASTIARPRSAARRDAHRARRQRRVQGDDRRGRPCCRHVEAHREGAPDRH